MRPPDRGGVRIIFTSLVLVAGFAAQAAVPPPASAQAALPPAVPVQTAPPPSPVPSGRDVRIHKETPVLDGIVDAVGVELSRRRSDLGP